MFYDAKFGRKRVEEQKEGSAHQTDQGSVQNGYGSDAASNGNGNAKNTSDMAIFEQFRHQVGFCRSMLWPWVDFSLLN